MTARTLYRIAAGWFVVFGCLHTYGFLNFRPPTAEGLAVFASMNAVHFTVKGNEYSYGRFYEGFGLIIGVNMFFSAFLCWCLAGTKARPIAWGLCAVQVAGVALAARYFGPPQIVAGVLAAALTAWAAAKTGSVESAH